MSLGAFAPWYKDFPQPTTANSKCLCIWQLACVVATTCVLYLCLQMQRHLLVQSNLLSALGGCKANVAQTAQVKKQQRLHRAIATVAGVAMQGGGGCNPRLCNRRAIVQQLRHKYSWTSHLLSHCCPHPRLVASDGAMNRPRYHKWCKLLTYFVTWHVWVLWLEYVRGYGLRLFLFRLIYP